MLNLLYEKSFAFSNTQREALRQGLIKINDIDPREYYLAVECANSKKVSIPVKFLKEMSSSSLFENLPRKEVVGEVINRMNSNGFEIPDKTRWREYKIPLSLQKLLIPYLVKLDRKILTRWKHGLNLKISAEIVSIRRREGRKNAKPKEDPLVVAIRKNDTDRFKYFNLNKLDKTRFLNVLDDWLKAGDEVKVEIFQTPYVNLLNKEQYLDLLKSWLNAKYCYHHLTELSLDTFRALTPQWQYKVLLKYVLKGTISKFVPLPTIEEVQQVILPELLANNTDAEKLFFRYKTKWLVNEMEKYVNGYKITECFDTKMVKQLKVIKTGIAGYYPSDEQLKFQVDVYDWVLQQDNVHKSALSRFFLRNRG